MSPRVEAICAELDEHPAGFLEHGAQLARQSRNSSADPRGEAQVQQSVLRRACRPPRASARTGRAARFTRIGLSQNEWCGERGRARLVSRSSTIATGIAASTPKKIVTANAASQLSKPDRSSARPRSVFLPTVAAAAATPAIHPMTPTATLCNTPSRMPSSPLRTTADGEHEQRQEHQAEQHLSSGPTPIWRLFSRSRCREPGHGGAVCRDGPSSGSVRPSSPPVIA